MPLRRPTSSPGGRRGPWAVLAALLAGVLVPTGCVLWFMTTAMRNERWAVRQRLTQTYRGDLRKAQDRLREYWSGTLVSLAGQPGESAPRTFARLVRAGVAGAVVVHDGSGRPAYPVGAIPAPEPADATPAWQQAADLELAGDPAALAQAAKEYAEIADRSQDADLAASALRAQARCLIRAGRSSEALPILTGRLSAPALRDARGPDGRLVVPNAMLLALQLIGDSGQPAFRRVADELARRLNDYGGAVMLSSQRRFLMRELSQAAPDAAAFPTLAAEDLAAEYLAEPVRPALPSRLTRSGRPGLWHFAGPGGRIVAVVREQRLLAALASAAGLNDPPAWTTLRLVRPALPEATEPDEEAFLSVPAAKHMPGWELRLHLVGDNPFAVAAARQRTAYLWTGTLGIVVIAAFALLVAGHLGRQMKLTRLKNDLIATVSHELKTPLASMRAMVDTLVAGRCKDRQKELEYFGLIAKENERLSRLIDNFLTFSRMERNKRAFEADELKPGEIVSQAVDSAAERFEGPGCRLEVRVQPDLPTIVGDRDALITALLNLLSNARKYSGPDKHVVVRAYADGADVCLAVSDNGVGLSRRAARKVFDRFYQVDQRVSRGVGGCGLGLSIVKFVVDAHGGSVEVASTPGEGSTFTIRLPAPRAPAEQRNHP